MNLMFLIEVLFKGMLQHPVGMSHAEEGHMPSTTNSRTINLLVCHGIEQYPIEQKKTAVPLDMRVVRLHDAI
jgi:hypothetical protein